MGGGDDANKAGQRKVKVRLKKKKKKDDTFCEGRALNIKVSTGKVPAKIKTERGAKTGGKRGEYKSGSSMLP